MNQSKHSLDAYLTIAEVAEMLNVSTDTIARRFARLPDVVDHGHEAQRQKRRYRVLRIPMRAVQHYISQHSGRPKAARQPAPRVNRKTRRTS